MRLSARVVLVAAVVFSIAMGALSEGGWWWAWLAGAVLLLGRGMRLPLLRGVRFDAATRYVLRENRRTRRHTRRLARQRRRRIRAQHRAARDRKRQVR
jgi:hypothetical protein